MKDNHPEFIPQWTKAVQEFIGKFNDNNTDYELQKKYPNLIIEKQSCCLVGEAHHFKNDYGSKCDSCYQESFKIIEVLSTNDLDNFYEWKDKLYKHMQEKHPEMLK